MSVPMVKVEKSGKVKTVEVPIFEKDYHHQVPNKYFNFKCPGRGIRKRSHPFRPDYLEVYNSRGEALLTQVKCSRCGRSLFYKAWKEKGTVRVLAMYQGWFGAIKKELDILVFPEAEV